MTPTYDVVAAVAQAICTRIGDARYHLWFQGKTRLQWDGEHLTIGVPNLFLQDYLKQKFGPDVQHAASEACGKVTPIRFSIDPQLFQFARVQQNEAEKNKPPRIDQPAIATAPPKFAGYRMPRERRWRQLGDFVVGASNRVAHASAVSLVEAPEDSPIPLVVHGPVGVGKTHLLEGIASGLSRRFPDWRMQFLTAEEFTNRFVQAMHQQKLGGFRKAFRDCDALFVDDVNFFARKQATQEEFLHTLDALATDHRMVVVSTDCHPRLADHLLPELTDRLVGGAVWGVTTPDRATRRDILRLKSARVGGLPDAVLDFLADNLRGNVRELVGAIHSIVHLAKATERRIDVDLAREALGDLLRHSLRLVTLHDVERAVCDGLGVSRELLLSKKRSWVYSYPRMLAMFIARVETSATYSEIGKHFGGRNHSTAVAAEKKVRDWLKQNLTLQLGKRTMPIRDIVERIERMLEG